MAKKSKLDLQTALTTLMLFGEESMDYLRDKLGRDADKLNRPPKILPGMEGPVYQDGESGPVGDITQGIYHKYKSPDYDTLEWGNDPFARSVTEAEDEYIQIPGASQWEENARQKNQEQRLNDKFQVFTPPVPEENIPERTGFFNKENTLSDWLFKKLPEDVKQRGVIEGLHDLTYPVLKNENVEPIVEPIISDVRMNVSRIPNQNLITQMLRKLLGLPPTINTINPKNYNTGGGGSL